MDNIVFFFFGYFRCCPSFQKWFVFFLFNQGIADWSTVRSILLAKREANILYSIHARKCLQMTYSAFMIYVVYLCDSPCSVTAIHFNMHFYLNIINNCTSEKLTLSAYTVHIVIWCMLKVFFFLSGRETINGEYVSRFLRITKQNKQRRFTVHMQKSEISPLRICE